MNYVPGAIPKDEPPDIPRLFIRGSAGGSIKIDLRGLGLDLSGAAYGHWVADNQFASLGINRGDIAIVDPFPNKIHHGDLVLLEIGGREVLRRLEKKKSLWFLKSGEVTPTDWRPLMLEPLGGIVVSVLRLFAKTKAANFRGTDANFKSGYEQSASKRKQSIKRDSVTPASGMRYKKLKSRLFLLAGENAPSYRLSELEKKRPTRLEQTPGGGASIRLRSHL